MWHDCPFSWRNKTTEWAVGVGIGDNREMGGGGGSGQKLKEGGGVGNIGEDRYKIGELGPSTNFD